MSAARRSRREVLELTPYVHSAHVSAITVSPGHRRLGLASMMMDLLERVGERERTWLCVLAAVASSSSG